MRGHGTHVHLRGIKMAGMRQGGAPGRKPGPDETGSQGGVSERKNPPVTNSIMSGGLSVELRGIEPLTS